MSYNGIKSLSLFLVAVTLMFSLVQLDGYAQFGGLLLEAQQHWDTYGVGATCISGSHNLFLENIDDDAEVEIMTGGSSYGLLSNGSATLREAPLKIWNWDGENVTLKAEHGWSGTINCVYAADVDGDGKFELLTSGSIRNDSGTFPSLRVWSWDGESVTLRASVEGVLTSAFFVYDVDHDEAVEIVSVGRFINPGQYGAKLCVWSLNGNELVLRDSVEWCITNVTSVTSVFARDLDGDGEVEIVTGGYAYDLRNSSGQLRVWQYSSSGLSLTCNREWRLVEGVYGLTIAGGVQGNTVVNNVKVGDVDSDGTPEIITGGFAYDGENINGQLRIWSWNGMDLLLEKSEEWASDYLTEIKCVSLGDVDGDSELEIVTSGGVGAEGSFANDTASPTQGQLRVWSWDGANLTLEYGQDWTVGDGFFAWNVASGDVDGDEVEEIVTVGCMGMGSLCDPDMRVWSVKKADANQIFPYVALALTSSAIMVLAGFLLLFKKIKQSRLSRENN